MAQAPEIPGYSIIEPLGEGGMAMVYLAVQENFQRKVAVKILSQRLLSDPSFGDRFLREARIVAQLSHQNIVPVFDVGQNGDCHYIAMELLRGGDLKQRLAKGIPLLECLNIVQQIASALHYASSKNFVHRDIKPENILFREDGSAVVSDFGIARSTESETNMTLTGTIIGTPSYMSPEQAQALTLDGRSDLYSLGIILFEMLTGNVPYTADSAISIGLKHITDPIPELPEEVADFQGIIDKALAKSPEDRFQHGREFIDALDELAHDLEDGSSATTIISADALKRHKSASNRRRASGSTVARARTRTGGVGGRTGGASGRAKTGGGRTSMSRARAGRSGSQAVNSNRKPLLIASIIGVLVVAGGVGGWLYNTGGSFIESRVEVSAFSAKTKALLAQALTAQKDGRLYEPANNSAQYFYTTALALDPQNLKAIQGIESLITQYLDNAQQAINSQSEEGAVDWLNRSSQIAFYASDQSLLERQQNLRAELFQMQQQNIRQAERLGQLEKLLASAQQAITDNRLSSPAGNNAYDMYQSILALDPENQQALKGIENIAATYLTQSAVEAEKANFVRARALIAAAIQIDSQHPALQRTQLKINQLEQQKRIQEMTAVQQQSLSEAELLQQQQQARKNRAQQITTLLKGAEKDLVADRLQSPPGDNAVQKFRQVLQLEPSNLDALEGLQKVGEKYVLLANTALKRQSINKADGYLNIAQKLVPNSQKLFAARRSVLDAKENVARQRDLQLQREREIKQLLAAATEDLQAGRLSSPLGNNALEKYSQVLAVDAINAKANTGRNKIVNGLVIDTGKAIAVGNFKNAQAYIATMARFFPKGSKTRQLKADLLRAEGQYARQQKEKTDLLKRAEKLAIKPTTEVINNQLRTLYVRILKIEKNNGVANVGLMRSSDFDLSLASVALKDRNYAAAASYIKGVEAITPKHPALATIKQQLVDAKEAAIEAEKQIASAEKEYEKTIVSGDDNITRNALKAVYRNILGAKNVDPGHPKIKQAMISLENKYIEKIQFYTQQDSFQRGNELVTDALSMELSKARIGEQKKIIEAKEKEYKAQKKKKRLTRQMGVF